MEREQVRLSLQVEMTKWDNLFCIAREKGKRIEKEIANARSQEVMSVALLLGFTGAEILGSPFILDSDADRAWRIEHRAHD